mgnify:CR=1 FL=1
MKVGDLVKPIAPYLGGQTCEFSESHPKNYVGLVINTDPDPKAPGCVIVLNPRDGSFHKWHTSRLRLIV